MPESTPTPSQMSDPDFGPDSSHPPNFGPGPEPGTDSGTESPTQQARQSIQRLTAILEDAEKLGDKDTPAQDLSAPLRGRAATDGSLADAMLTTRKGIRAIAPSAALGGAVGFEPGSGAGAKADANPTVKVMNSTPDAAAPADSPAVSPKEEGGGQTVGVTRAGEDRTTAELKAADPEAAELEAAELEAAEPETEAKATTLSPDQQVRIKREEGYLSLIFPREQAIANPEVTVDFVDSELWQQLQQRLSGSERFWQNDTPVHLNAQTHLLDARQLQELEEALDRFDLKLTRIATSRRQTAVAAATAGFSVDQGAELPQLLPFSSEAANAKKKTLAAEPLYLQTTVRSGAEIRHPGSVIIMGDLNPGSSVVADGDILIWGRLRGIAHAGASGNPESIILAMRLEPTQLRIAESVARVPDSAPATPEVAYVTAKGDIRIAEAAGFIRPRR